MGILIEFKRELKRNFKCINDYYTPDPRNTSPDVMLMTPPAIMYLVAPVGYAVGILETVIESPIRGILNHYPAV